MEKYSCKDFFHTTNDNVQTTSYRRSKKGLNIFLAKIIKKVNILITLFFLNNMLYYIADNVTYITKDMYMQDFEANFDDIVH